MHLAGLRALLIQIGLKHIKPTSRQIVGLRALLIQIGLKQSSVTNSPSSCLRALFTKTDAFYQKRIAFYT